MVRSNPIIAIRGRSKSLEPFEDEGVLIVCEVEEGLEGGVEGVGGRVFVKAESPHLYCITACTGQ